MTGSTRFRLDTTDVGKALMYAAIFGIAAGLEWLIEFLASGVVDVGNYKLAVTGVLATLLEIARRWLVDHKQGEIVPFSAAITEKKRKRSHAKKAGMMLLLASLPLLGGAAWAERGVDNVSVVEVNTFGDQPRTAVIYRDEGNIRDWRWLTTPAQVPHSLGDGRYVAVWGDQGKPRTVYCMAVRWTRTKEDRELAERSRLPEHKRLKLSR